MSESSRRSDSSCGSAVDAALFVLLLSVVAWRTAPQLAGLIGIEATGAAPNAWLTSIDGREVELEALRGKVVIVTFWATWCRQCGPGMKALQDINAKYGAADIQVLAVSIGNERETDIRRYLEDRDLDLWVGRAPPALRAQFGGVPGIPTTVVIDRSGFIRHRFYGPLSKLVLGTVVARLVRRRVETG